jgi:hypothetical protein
MLPFASAYPTSTAAVRMMLTHALGTNTCQTLAATSFSIRLLRKSTQNEREYRRTVVYHDA